MRNLKRNVSAFVICLGLTITTLCTPAIANAATKEDPAPNVSVLADVEVCVVNTLDLNVLVDAAANL